MPRKSRYSPTLRRLAAPLAGLAATVLVGGGLSPTAWAAPPSGWIEPPPAVVISATWRAQTDLEILQAAIEAYRGQHFFKYPEASSLPELVRLLHARRLLPDGYKPSFTVAEFRADRKGYKISAQAEGEVLTIETPERFDPFWSFLW